jgi:hypothetical protein
LIALDAEMTEQQVRDLFQAKLVGKPVEAFPDLLKDDFQVACLADGSAAVHIQIKLTELPPFTTIKFVVHMAFERGIAAHVISVRKGRLGL